MKQIKIINPENVSKEEVEKYATRKAARAIVFDENELVALLHVTNNKFYKLPGGGIEISETREEALKRECLEEIGCNIEIVKEVGSIVEYRKKFKVKQTSYCYIAKLVGEKGVPNLEQDEIEDGFKTAWMPLKEAIIKIKESHPTVYEGPYMVARDFVLLQETNRIINH